MIPKNRIIVGIICAGIFVVKTASAQHIWEDPNGWWGGHFSYDKNTGDKYVAQEVSLDLFASYINPEQRFGELFDTNIRQGFWGGGAGVNYFFTRGIGVGADFNISSKPDDLNLVDQVTGDVLFRVPIANSGLAPYVIGSGGRAMSPRYEWVYGGGVGLEMRVNPTTGIFSDARFLWADQSTADDRLVIRAGVRLAF
ncbi:MAG TPA: hypothetical protein VKY92_08285 [Verrucomicrobiae bacterium]|nr:hypothetical protein [Verrucomicrobiae bacterium]